MTFVFMFLALRLTGFTDPLNDPYGFEVEVIAAQQDTIPPIQERYGNHLTNPSKNPFDLKDPATIQKDVQYDPDNQRYVITEKVGEQNFRPPTYLTFEEYLAWRQKNEEQAYFKELSGIVTDGNGLSAVDPIARFDVKSSLIDRLFGGTGVNITPQGNVDLTFGYDVNKVENPIITERARSNGGFDFDMDIRMNVSGKIGEKLSLDANYNTNATFDFDQQIKINYNSDMFSEDEIIKKIEAGNVSLPLQSSLIQGAQSLFGLKTELQFGRLRLSMVASQQKSQRENLKIENGSQIQEFEMRADQYDENRHFFLSHYNREIFEPVLSKYWKQVCTDHQIFTVCNLF